MYFLIAIKQIINKIMQHSVHAHNIPITDKIKSYINDHLTKLEKKYCNNAHATVNFVDEHREFICKIVLNDEQGKHKVITSDASGENVKIAFSKALEKITHQLSKINSKHKEH